MKIVKNLNKWLIVVDKKSRERLNDWWGHIIEPIIEVDGKEFVVRDSVSHKDLACTRALSIASIVGWYIGTKNCDDKVPTVDVRVVKNEK